MIFIAPSTQRRRLHRQRWAEWFNLFGINHKINLASARKIWASFFWPLVFEEPVLELEWIAPAGHSFCADDHSATVAANDSSPNGKGSYHVCSAFRGDGANLNSPLGVVSPFNPFRVDDFIAPSPQRRRLHRQRWAE
jgi:hypothetical protein